MKPLLILMTMYACRAVLLTDEQAKLMKLPTFKKGAYGIVGKYQQDTDSLALKKIDVSVETHGLIAHVVTELEYNNTANGLLEDTKFVFPLDTNAAVFHLEVQCTGRESIVAKIEEKQKAKQQYSKALKEGHTAILGEHQEDYADIFSLSLGNIPGQATCTAIFKYVQEMYKYNFENYNMMFFRYPVELAYRYGDEQETTLGFIDNECDLGRKCSCRRHFSGFNQESRESLCKHSRTNKDLDFNFTLKVVEPSTTTINLVDDERFAVTEDSKMLAFKKEYKFEKNIDVFINLPSDNEPIAILEKGNPADTDGFGGTDVLMVNFNPELPRLEETAHQEYVIILDRSGSMKENMGIARSTVIEWIDQLPEGEGCRFNIISFGEVFLPWKDHSVECTEENRMEAKLAVSKFDAKLGGTELYRCLDFVLQKDAPTGIKQVFVVTDGSVNNVKDVITLVRERKEYNRIFSFGIGPHVSSELVQGIAQFNGISKLLTDDVEFLKNSVTNALSVSRAVAFHNIQITIPGYTIRSPTEWPILLKDVVIMTDPPFALFQGVPFSMYAQFSSEFPKKNAELVITATHSNGKEVRHSVPFSISTSETDNLPIHRLASKRFIDELTNHGTQSSREQIVDISKNMNVVSKLTAFIGVGKNCENLMNETSRNCNKSRLLRDQSQHDDIYADRMKSINTNKRSTMKSINTKTINTNECGMSSEDDHDNDLFVENKVYLHENSKFIDSNNDNDNDLFVKNKVELDLYEKTKSYSSNLLDIREKAHPPSYSRPKEKILLVFPCSPESPNAERYNEQVELVKEAIVKKIKKATINADDLYIKMMRQIRERWEFTKFPIALMHRSHLYLTDSVNVSWRTTTVIFRCADEFQVQTITFEVELKTSKLKNPHVQTTITLGDDSKLSLDESFAFLSENEIFVIPIDEAKEFYTKKNILSLSFY